MAIGCEEVSARMMELLYGELAGEDRAAVEAHLGGCASCRAELAAFQGTRAAARRALDADAPPARTHDAILRAAAAAVAAKKPQPMQTRPTAARASLWERLRGRWTLPTFATVGAVAVVVLASKVFLEPDKTVELGRQTVAPAAPQAPRAQAIAEAPEPTRPAPAATAAPAEKALANETADREKGAQREVSKHAATPHHSAAKAAASGAGLAVGGLGAAQGVPKGGGERDRGRQDIGENALDGLMDEGANSDKSFHAAPAAKPAKREFAPPPPPRAQLAPAPAAPASAPRVLEEEDDAVEESPRRRAGGAGVPGGAAGPPPAAHAGPKMKKAAEPEDEMESATTGEEQDSAPARAAQTEKGKAPAKDDKPAARSPVAQADRLFAEGRWAEAARAYRELLRSDPRNADAGRWKQRLTAAEAEMASPAHAASRKDAPP